MKLSLQPEELPFKVGDKLFVNLPYSSIANKGSHTNDKPYFEAEVFRIFLEFPTAVSVVNKRKDVHHFAITVVTYDLKPLGFYNGASRVTLRVDLNSNEKYLFATEEQLLQEG